MRTMTSDARTALLARAEAYLADDPDQATRTELRALIDSGDTVELEDRFRARLEFGTAGLRGVVGAGPNRMNRAVVRAAAAGLCSYLQTQVEGALERGLVVGFDGRRMSREFADETAEIAVARGFRVWMFEDVIPTPILAYAAKEKNAAAAVMVTASHNPPEYNGYKVYWGNGAQIIPPHDARIAAAIEACGPLREMLRASLSVARKEGRLMSLGQETEDAYHEALQKLLVSPQVPRDITIAYTALHGVGDRHVARALRAAGFERVHHVADQAKPDAAFPTVRFPNPEEPGAMDRVLELARSTSAELVLANDPDADRLAVAVLRKDGDYLQLTGNDVGCLLAHYLLEHAPKDGRRAAVLSSIVSSPWLGAIAETHGAYFEQTLTGFKWIANRGAELETEGMRFVMGYEEALGYTVGSLVRDKDGISAACLVAEMAAWCKAQGRTLEEELEHCARRYGLYLSRQVSVTLKGADGAQQIASIMNRIREKQPEAIGEHAVLAHVDLGRGERRVRGGAVTALTLPRTNAIALELDGGHRVMLRPSGTEPKIKYYFDLREAIGEREPVASARQRGERVLDGLVHSFSELVA